MTTLKRLACSFMALTMFLGLTACSAKTFDHKKMVKFGEDHDYEMFDDTDDYLESFGEIIIGDRPDEGAYMSATGKDAQEVYDVVFNRFANYPDYDVTEATSVIYFDDDAFIQFYVFTMEEAKDAEKLYKKITKKLVGDDKEKGDEKGYSYYIMFRDDYSVDEYYGIYLKGNTVLFIQAQEDADELADEICKAYGVISPTEAA